MDHFVGHSKNLKRNDNNNTNRGSEIDSLFQRIGLTTTGGF